MVKVGIVGEEDFEFGDMGFAGGGEREMGSHRFLKRIKNQREFRRNIYVHRQKQSICSQFSVVFFSWKSVRVLSGRWKEITNKTMGPHWFPQKGKIQRKVTS